MEPPAPPWSDPLVAKDNPLMTDTPPTPSSKVMLWTGRAVSALPALALLLSGIFKFMPSSPELEKNLEHIGWRLAAVAPLGITELVATILYIIPQTSVLGAILITGYMGGAIATHA